MKWIRVSFYVTFIILMAGILAGCSKTSAEKAVGDLPEVVVYKDINCGCCEGWIAHMKKNGFTVTSANKTNMPEIKTELGVGVALRSCHTAIIDGYVVEGHVPAEDIVRMLKERPTITGLAAPGMPGGSPGMETAPKKPYKVVAFKDSGQQYTYAQH